MTPNLSPADQPPDSQADAFLARLQRFVTGSSEGGFDFRTLFWLVVSLAASAYFANQALHQAFSSQYVVQDDARQHVFWMERYLDPELFPRDVIADYYQAIAPSGYSALYRGIAQLGVHPLLLNKLLPMALGLITTGLCFGVCLQMLPVPGAAFFGSLILNQSLWMQDDLVSATPRAFFYPLFLAFLFCLQRKSRLACLAVIALQGLFYPPAVFISAGVLVLSLISIEKQRPHFSRARADYVNCALGLGVVLCVLLLYAFKLRDIGPVITAAEARVAPEFLPGGRTSFFGYGFWRFWLTRKTSGLLPDPLLVDFPLYAALLLPFLAYSRRGLAGKMAQKFSVLPRVIVTSLVMFAAAHAFLFKLYNPSRYTEHTLRIVFSIAAGIAIAIVIDALLDWSIRSKQRPFVRRAAALTLAAAVVGLLVIYPRFLSNFPETKYRTGRESALYEFIGAQKKDALVASLASEVKNIPAFSKRSILVAREYALPFHVRYYAEMEQRASDLIRASYTEDLAELQSFIRKYGVAFVILDRNAFQARFIENDSWIMQYQPAASDALEQLNRGAVPALSRLTANCEVFESEGYIVLSAECILSASQD